MMVEEHSAGRPSGAAHQTPRSPAEELERSKAELRLSWLQKIASLERFAGAIVHDFNNALTVIVGHSQLLLEQPEIGSSARARVERILDASFRAATLTGQLLIISRKQFSQPAVLNLNRVIESLGSMLGFLLGDQIELTTSLAPDLANVSADHAQMEQILVNFCIHARDAMPKTGRVLLETCNLDVSEANPARHFPMRPGRYVQLSVSDSGLGMDPETAARIFEPFFTTKERDNGIRLGLATVHCIVKQSNGYIRVQSEPGQGSTFFVYLPATSAPASSPKSESTSLQGSETILVVESSPPVRALIREALESLGYTVLEAEDGTRARELANQHQNTAALLLDVCLEGSSAVELVSSLRTERPALKLLQMTAPPAGFVNYTFHGPGTAIIQKPFTAEALTHRLRALLDQAD